MDTRPYFKGPVAQRWRGSAIREPASRPLPKGAIDVAALPGLVADAGRPPYTRQSRPLIFALFVAGFFLATLIAAAGVLGLHPGLRG